MAAIENGLIMEVTSHDEIDVNNETQTVLNHEPVNTNGRICVSDQDMLNEVLTNAHDGSFNESVELQYSSIPVDAVDGDALEDGTILDSVEHDSVSFVTTNHEIQVENGELSEGFADPNGLPIDPNGDSIANGDSMIVNDEGIIGNSVSEGNTTFQISNLSHQNIVRLQPTQQQVIINSSGQAVQSSQQILLTQTERKVTAPLGSSLNPIRIIQQGNQYTPVQQLTSDQLQQIMHVVQQQQAAKSGSSVLYNPETNTKIVYRVVYPSQLHKDANTNSSSDKPSDIPRRTYKKRNKEEEEKIDGPDLSKEEKEMRKKMRPKTRSGRVSKPPKHMVSDYKHIHVLDYDEDYDDDNGGYSDFKLSDGEEELPTRTLEDMNNSGLGK